MGKEKWVRKSGRGYNRAKKQVQMP